MALAVVIAKNQTISDIVLTRLGLTVPGSGQITLTDYASFFEIASDSVLNNAVNTGDIVINDGTSDLSAALGDAYLDATGNFNGPVGSLTTNTLIKLNGTTGRYAASTGITVDSSDNINLGAGGITTTGSVNLAGGSFIFPTDASPTPTVEGQAVWDTDDNVLRIGNGATTTTLGTGDVIGPGSAVDNAITRFDTTTGKLLQSSVVTLSDTGTFTRDSGVMRLETTTSGNLEVASIAALNLSSTTGDWQASGALTIDSSGGAISIGSDANTGAINIGTGAAARVITIGNAIGATAVNIAAGTNGLELDSTGFISIVSGTTLSLDGQNTDITTTNDIVIRRNATSGGTLTLGGTTASDSFTTINVGTQAVATTLTMGNGTGATALTLNSGTGAINIGTNAVAHTVTVGTTTGAAATNIQAGTGNITLTAPASIISGRLETSKGADIASGSTITFGSDGNSFDITGTTTINYITTTGWTAGSIVTLQFDGIVIITNNAGSVPGGTAAIITHTGSNYTTAAGVVITLWYDGTVWRFNSLPATSGSGDVVGPGSSTDNALARFDGITGKLIQNSVVLIDDTGNMTGLIDIQASSALTIDSTSTISIGSDADAQAINIGTGAAARTITVGNGTGATAVDLNSGTGAINIGTNAVAHTVTVGTTTGAGSTVLQTGSGAMTFTAGGIYDVNAAGAVTLDSTGGAISIGAGADAQAINIGTGAAARTITIGNGTGATSVVLDAGTGAINIGTNAVAHTVTVGTTTGAGSTVLQTGTGAMTFTAGGIYDVNSTGAVTLDSTGGAISIGNDADAQAINIGTGAAARQITIGNITGATAVDINAGTGSSSWTMTGAGTFGLVAGTGAINIGTNATVHTTSLGSTTGGSITNINAGTAGLNLLVSAGGSINVGTGSNLATITIGNTTSSTAVIVNAGTGASSFAANNTDHSTTIGSTTGTSATTIQSGSGNLTLTSPDVRVGTLLTVPNTGLHLLDTDASHDLIIVPGSNLSSDRTLTLTTGDASRTLNFTGAQGSIYYTDASGNLVSLAPGTSGQYLKTLGAAANPAWDTVSGSGGGKIQIPITIDGGGYKITTGAKGFFPPMLYAGTITGWRISTDLPSGSIIFDIWKANGSVPSNADSITASAKPELSSAQTGSSTTLTSWTTAVVAGDIFGFEIESVTGEITRATLIVDITPS